MAPSIERKQGQDDTEADQPARVAQGRKDGDSPPRRRESRLQIVVTWLSGLLLLTVVGYLIWEGSRPPAPADFSYRIGSVREADGSFYVPISVTNTGGESVKGLVVSLELLEGETAVERSSVTLDWLPEGSTRRAVLAVDEDPSLHEMKVGIDGYQVP